jgi:alanyl-tRNA synthetase
MERELAEAKKALALGGGGSAAAAGPEDLGGVAFIGQIIEGLDPKELRGLIDANKSAMGSGVSAVIAISDGRASIAAGVTDDLVGRFNAVDLVRAGVEMLGGKGGGGRPDMAQGGGPDGAKAQAALDAVRALIRSGAQ